MVRLSISEFSTYRWSLKQEIEELSRRGIQNIGLWRTKLSDLDCDYATDLLYTNNLSVSSLSWAGGFTGSCGLSHEQAIEDGVAAIRTAARIGAECLILHPGNRNGHTRRHSRRLFQTAIERLLPVALDFGVTLAMELFSRQEAIEWTVFDSVQQSLSFCNDYLPQELALVLDLYHVGSNSAVYECIPDLVPRLALVQLADRTTHLSQDCRCQPGCGHLPIQQWFNDLEDNGYRGRYEVEVFGPLVGKPRYRQMLDDSVATFQRLKTRNLQAPGISTTSTI